MDDDELYDDESAMAELGTDDEADVPDLDEDVQYASEEDGGVQVPSAPQQKPGIEEVQNYRILEESPAPPLAQGYAPVRTLRQSYPGQVPMGPQRRPRMTPEQELLFLARNNHRGAQAAYVSLKRQEAALGMQERMRLSRLQNQLGVIEQADWLTPQEKLNAAFLLQTKIDPLRMREEAEIRRSRNEALQARTLQMSAMLRDAQAATGLMKSTQFKLDDGTNVIVDLSGKPHFNKPDKQEFDEVNARRVAESQTFTPKTGADAKAHLEEVQQRVLTMKMDHLKQRDPSQYARLVEKEYGDTVQNNWDASKRTPVIKAKLADLERRLNEIYPVEPQRAAQSQPEQNSPLASVLNDPKAYRATLEKEVAKYGNNIANVKDPVDRERLMRMYQRLKEMEQQANQR